MVKQPKVFHMLQLAHAALFRAADKFLKKEANVSTSQLAVLMGLLRQDGVPISNLADLLNLSYSSMSGLIDRMVSRGLLDKVTDEKDMRVQKIFITEQGRRIGCENLAQIKAINAELLSPFTPLEQEVIGRFLTHVADQSAALFEKDSPFASYRIKETL